MQDFLDSLNFKNKEDKDRFETKLIELEGVANTFMSACVLGLTSRFVYCSSKVEDLLGFPAYKFTNDVNFSFIKSITPEKFLTYISKKNKKSNQARHFNHYLIFEALRYIHFMRPFIMIKAKRCQLYTILLPCFTPPLE